MPKALDLKQAMARFGADAKAKLANPGASGEPEDQLRAPLERLFADLAELCGIKREWLAAVGTFEWVFTGQLQCAVFQGAGDRRFGLC